MYFCNNNHSKNNNNKNNNNVRNARTYIDKAFVCELNQAAHKHKQTIN